MSATSPCKRCWRCCISTKPTPDYLRWTLRQRQRFDWIRFGNVSVCPVMAVNDDGQPHCLIYSERPKVCRDYRCDFMGKQPRTLKCSLCGQRYAVLNSTFHVSDYYRLKFCETCTSIILNMIRKTKVAMAVEK